jgi:tetratricopeptide (TPR) repeat protein
MLKIRKKGQDAKTHQEQGIVTILNKVSEVLSDYRKQFIVVASIAAALCVIAGGYSLVRSADERKASPLLAAAYESYTRSPGMSAADTTKALELFRNVQKKYSGTMSGAIAQYYIGNCLVELGRLDEALKEYQFFVAKYSGEKYLLALAYQRLGYLYGTLGRQADAVKAFEQSEALGGPGVATVELARIYESSGNITESQKKFKIVQEKLGGTNWSVEAMGKVQKIETQKPVVK